MLITRAVIELGQFQPRGSGQAGLAHAAFSAELQDPHVCILRTLAALAGERTASRVCRFVSWQRDVKISGFIIREFFLAFPRPAILVRTMEGNRFAEVQHLCPSLNED